MKATRIIMTALVCLLPFQASARDLVVFAASSLKEPIDQIAAAFGDVVVSYGGSGTLARQIGFGAPVDVVVLAHPQWMDVLDDAGLVTHRAAFASNTLVFVANTPMEVKLNAPDLLAVLGDGRIAMGLTKAVPAGIYGKAALEHLELWDAVSGALAEVDNVRAALALVARKEAPLGIVYATDARVSEDVHVVASFPPQSHPAIQYEVAQVAQSDHPALASFMDALRGESATNALKNAGFLPPQVAP